MNPSKEETDQTLARIQADTDQVFFHDLGNHNRAIARDRIQKHQERKFYAPNHAQMSGAVRGGDDRRRPFPWAAFAVLVVIAAAAILLVKAVMP